MRSLIRIIVRADGPFVIDEDEFDRNVYLEGFRDNSSYFYLHAQISNVLSLAYVHLYIYEFSAATVRQLRRDFKVIKLLLKIYGVKVVMSLMLVDKKREMCVQDVVFTPQWVKFVRLLGFKAPANITICGNSYKQITMEI